MIGWKIIFRVQWLFNFSTHMPWQEKISKIEKNIKNNFVSFVLIILICAISLLIHDWKNEVRVELKLLVFDEFEIIRRVEKNMFNYIVFVLMRILLTLIMLLSCKVLDNLFIILMQHICAQRIFLLKQYIILPLY